LPTQSTNCGTQTLGRKGTEGWESNIPVTFGQLAEKWLLQTGAGIHSAQARTGAAARAETNKKNQLGN
jgi:hypothetical protein